MKKFCRNLFKLVNGVFIFAIISMMAYLYYLRSCEWSPEVAAEYATEHAEKKSVGLCARYVRKAIIAGGIPLYWGGNAYHYKYVLPVLGFDKVDSNEKRKVGDIVVFQPIGGRRFGHISMWNGKQWVSDFKQRNFIVHSDYWKEGCEYAIYREAN